jgi:hypothetical protein
VGKREIGEEVKMRSLEDMAFQFIIEEQKGKREFSYQMRGAILCGYTGRNQSAVRKHIEELKKEGVEPPPSVPMFYPKPQQGISLAEDIHVEGQETSGEVEYVLLTDGDRIYVGVGSDHTDRELERMDIPKSKQVCPSVLSKNLWNYEEIKDHWDSIQIRSWAVEGGERTLYQDSTVSTILPPEELVRLVQQRVDGSLEGIAIFSGTPPMVTEQILFSDRFEGELLDPILNRKITLGYSIHTLDWFKG